MTVMYFDELQRATNAFIGVLRDSGVPRNLWPNYARLSAEEIACTVADEIVGKVTKAQIQQHRVEQMFSDSQIEEERRKMMEEMDKAGRDGEDNVGD